MNKINNAARLILAIIVHCAWAVAPRRLRTDRAWQRKGIRLIKHTSCADSGIVYALMFGSGAGYIGGATAYLGLGCRVKNKCRGLTAKPYALGLTINANNLPLAGRY